MKTLFMLPLLLAPVAGYGQADLFHIEDVAPIKMYDADAGIGKGFQLAFSTLFFPDRVKNEWPVYGYKISEISTLCLRQQSVYSEKFAVNIAALVRPRRDLSENASVYLGVPIRPTEGGEITGRMEEICTGIEQSDLAHKLRIYDVNDLPSGVWKVEKPPSEEIIPLLSGTVTTGDVSERNYSMVWTLESPKPDTPKLKVGWKGYDPMSAEYRESWDRSVRKYAPDGGTDEDITYYLAKIGDNSQIDTSETATWSSSWTGRKFHTEGISDFTLGSRYSIGYSSKKSLQSFVDDWFFVANAPLPRAKANIRIDPFE